MHASEARRASLPAPAAAPRPPIECFVEADEAALFLKVERRTVLRWARIGHIPAYSLNPHAAKKDWRFLLSELDAWLRGQVNCPRCSCPASRSIQ